MMLQKSIYLPEIMACEYYRNDSKFKHLEKNGFMDKFTLIISVHERKPHVANLVNYYDGFPCKIIVADSSKNLTDIPKNQNVQIMHRANELYYKKMHEAVSKVTTPFTLELSDDDIVYMGAIVSCVEFLESSRGHVFADGRWDQSEYCRRLTMMGLNMQYRTVAQKTDVEEKLKFDYFIQSKFYSSNPLDRITKCLNEYFKAPNHSIVSTKALKEMYSFQINHPNLWPIRWWDKIWMFLACFKGNYRALDIRYGKRSEDPCSRLFSTLKNEYPKELQKDVHFPEIMKCEKNLEPFINLCKSVGHSKEKSKNFVTEVFRGVSK
tara:strand:- start:4447 stop:5412 length:966 start_codon:yes stop_codon:yes gene_type:complete